MRKNISVLVISIANPILVGIYENEVLIDTISKDGKTSDILPVIFDSLLKVYSIENIFYVNGPGSYMAIKVAYIFLKTISIVNKITFKSCDGFTFNNNKPIKALGKKFFFKVSGEIIIDFLSDSEILEEFKLPNSIKDIKFMNDTLPNYNLPFV